VFDPHQTDMPRERTFLMVKPDGVQRANIGEIITRFERRGFKLVAIKMVRPSVEQLERHYAEHKGKTFFQKLRHNLNQLKRLRLNRVRLPTHAMFPSFKELAPPRALAVRQYQLPFVMQPMPWPLI